MKEKPIIFSPAMVRAILAGRKTQTRRLCVDRKRKNDLKLDFEALSKLESTDACPYGRVGDRMWVKETWFHPDPNGIMYDASGPLYRADGEINFERGDRWHPPLFMPRWASRITLEITAVRVQRLHDISSKDAIAEGINIPYPRAAYAAYWAKLHSLAGWDSNPYVWVVSFKRV